jgi:DMSO/TMAO reductase YedYZ molybdopterin-dependent catalytic subunit
MARNLTRREFVRFGAVSAGLVCIRLDQPASVGVQTDGSFAGGKQLGSVAFLNEGRPVMNVPDGEELDGRLFTDLAEQDLSESVTPTANFYVRTRASKLYPDLKPWKVKVDGLVQRPWTLTVDDLTKKARPLGLHLMECAGNARFAHYGLISVAKWAGVTVADALDGVKAKPEAKRVLISGFDVYETQSASSIAGASWIFFPEELKNTGAFLATEMNDRPLSLDHGAPVRLVVPGWYGCTCIKWVQTITLVGEDVEASSQMREYAARTHQRGVPALAKDYESAIIDQAAMPVRVEKWLVGGKIKYRVVGILWGGTQPVKSLWIRFNPEEDYVPVDNFTQTKNDQWSFWTHAWSPKSPGTYSIRLMVKDSGVRTRRLDSGYYVRTVEVSEV